MSWNRGGKETAKSSSRLMFFCNRRYRSLPQTEHQLTPKTTLRERVYYLWCSKHDRSSPRSLRASPPEEYSVFALLRSRGSPPLFFLLLTYDTSLSTSSFSLPNWIGESDSKSCAFHGGARGRCCPNRASNRFTGRSRYDAPFGRIPETQFVSVSSRMSSSARAKPYRGPDNHYHL